MPYVSYTGIKYIDLPYLVKGMDVSFSGILTFIEKLAATQPTLVQSAPTQPTLVQPTAAQSALVQSTHTLPAVDDAHTSFTTVSAGLDETEGGSGSEPAMKKLALENHTSSTATSSATSSNGSSSSSSGGMSVAESFKADLCYSLQETLFAMLVIRILYAYTVYTCIRVAY